MLWKCTEFGLWERWKPGGGLRLRAERRVLRGEVEAALSKRDLGGHGRPGWRASRGRDHREITLPSLLWCWPWALSSNLNKSKSSLRKMEGTTPLERKKKSTVCWPVLQCCRILMSSFYVLRWDQTLFLLFIGISSLITLNTPILQMETLSCRELALWSWDLKLNNLTLDAKFLATFLPMWSSESWKCVPLVVSHALVLRNVNST